MRKQIVALAMVAMLVGCTSEWDPGRRSASLPQSGNAVQAWEKAGGDAGRQRRPASFASLPDRGELLAYDRSRRTQQRGAYTSHPIRLSEAHAFRQSHEGGELVVTAPNGEPLRFRYDHHIEHPDGNWTWVGRDADGADAVLTFGEKAVFGVIPDGDRGTLRVTTRQGRAWLVATDASREPDVNRAVTRSGGPDYLVPPPLGAAIASAQQQSPAMAAQEVQPAAVVGAIDVVLGYTNGYAAQLGGASAAVTRLTNLVAVANQAMANSQIVRRLRLVRAVQVTYPDATSNTLALEELTGYRSGTGTIPVPAALQPLRSARDQYGGDLVALVRAFRTPENDGCGIAWLIGSGQTQITSADAPYGYSVVSDGQDEDEGGVTYTCREESLAHEMGHNMGQAHNVDDAEDSGVHAYSYGYRETSATGFYTVMAYRLADSSQVSIRYFANPNVSFAGRATGVANSADNVRSMNQTMPIVATFRAQIVPAEAQRNDISGEGRSEIIFRNQSQQLVAWWEMNGAQVSATRNQGAGADYTLRAVGDFNGDGRADLAWTNAARRLVLFLSTGTAFTVTTVTNDHGAGWVLRGAGDVNGDGKSDLIFRNAGAQLVGWWEMNGAQVTRTRSQGAGNTYGLSATGDFNGDGRVDLVWSNSARKIVMFISTGSAFTSVTVTNDFGAGWLIEGAGDINGDSRADLIFRNASAQFVAWWEMNGAQVGARRNQGAGSAYTLVAIGDYNGDNKADLIWTNAARRLVMFQSLGTTFSSATVSNDHGAGWSVVDGGP